MDDGTKTFVLGFFSLRVLLNLGMLLTDNEPARLRRFHLLDIVSDVMAERVEAITTSLIRLIATTCWAAFQEENYRRQFSDAMDKVVECTHLKFARFTDVIYQSIFQENATKQKGFKARRKIQYS